MLIPIMSLSWVRYLAGTWIVAWVIKRNYLRFLISQEIKVPKDSKLQNISWKYPNETLNRHLASYNSILWSAAQWEMLEHNLHNHFCCHSRNIAGDPYWVILIAFLSVLVPHWPAGMSCSTWWRSLSALRLTLPTWSRWRCSLYEGGLEKRN